MVVETEGNLDCEKTFSTEWRVRNKKTCVEEVRSRVLLGRRRAVERPDPSGGIIRVEGDAGDIFHELLSCWDRVDR